MAGPLLVIAVNSAVVGRTIGEIGLPEGAIVAMVSRDGRLIAPKGATRLQAGDHVFVVAQITERSLVDRALTANRE